MSGNYFCHSNHNLFTTFSIIPPGKGTLPCNVFQTHKKALSRPVGWKQCCELVRPTRFERAAFGVGVRHSIQLSYGRIYKLYFILADDIHLLRYRQKYAVAYLVLLRKRLSAKLCLRLMKQTCQSLSASRIRETEPLISAAAEPDSWSFTVKPEYIRLSTPCCTWL